MEHKNYEEARKYFFESYKTFIDFLMFTCNEYSMYSILVLKKDLHNNLSKVNIVVRNSYNGDDMYNEYSNNVILSSEEAENLVNDIVNDFKDNHYISYSTVNTKNFTQVLQNTNFSLNIKLNNEYELKRALNFNSKINCSPKSLQKKISSIQI